MKKNIFDFLTANYSIFLEKWEKELKINLRALNNQYSFNGLHGSSAYFNSIHELIIKNLKSLTNDIIKNTLHVFSANIISDFTISEFTEALNELTYTALDRYEIIFDEQVKHYDSSPVVEKIVGVLKKELRENTHANILILLNKFEADIYSLKRINNAEKWQFVHT